MNDITCPVKENFPVRYGDICVSNLGNYYIIARLDDNMYVAVGLSNGNRWCKSTQSPEEAARDLTVLPDNTELQLTINTK